MQLTEARGDPASIPTGHENGTILGLSEPWKRVSRAAWTWNDLTQRRGSSNDQEEDED